MADRPNILYFVVHDLGRHLPCYGAPIEASNLDAFAESAVRFDRAFCNSPCCTPSRVCAMTGLYAHVSGGVGLAHMGWPLADDVPTIVDYLNEAGYETVHSGMEHERGPGRNRYEVDLQVEWETADAHRAVDEALTYLQERDRGRPFYLNIGSQQPHASTWSKAEQLYGGPVPPERVYLPPHVPETPQARERLGRFQAAIRYVDNQFGRLLEGLDRLDYAQDTIAVFTTDHGISAPRSKGTLYDRGVEIALLMRLPDGRLAGTAVDHLLQNMDLPPTLLEAAGAAASDALQGRSFWPLLEGSDYRPHERIFVERNFHGEPRVFGRAGDFVDRYDPQRAVRTPEFHYILRLDPRVKCRQWLPWEVPQEGRPTGAFGLPEPREPRPEEELYHVRHDPQEFVNLAGRPEWQDVRRELRRRLVRWMRETDDFALRGEVPSRRAEPLWGTVGGVPDLEEE